MPHQITGYAIANDTFSKCCCQIVSFSEIIINNHAKHNSNLILYIDVITMGVDD